MREADFPEPTKGYSNFEYLHFRRRMHDSHRTLLLSSPFETRIIGHRLQLWLLRGHTNGINHAICYDSAKTNFDSQIVQTSMSFTCSLLRYGISIRASDPTAMSILILGQKWRLYPVFWFSPRWIRSYEAPEPDFALERTSNPQGSHTLGLKNAHTAVLGHTIFSIFPKSSITLG